jgi:hypothetical protein
VGSGSILRGTLGEVGVVGHSSGDGYNLVVGYWGAVALSGQVTAVDPVVPVDLPLNLHAVPNPFNPSTTIQFNQPIPGAVRLRIYDVSGRLVQDLDGGERQAGPQSLIWNGRDRRGSTVSSGQYFAQVNLDRAKLGDVLKITLLK